MVKNTTARPRVADFGSKPRNFWLRFLSSQRFLALIGLVFLVVMIFPLARTYSQRRLVEKEIEDVKKQIAEYEDQNKQLAELAAYLQSEQSLEEQARLNLNLKKPGEEVVIIDAKSVPVVSTAASSTDGKSGNLAKWWHYYFH